MRPTLALLVACLAGAALAGPVQKRDASYVSFAQTNVSVSGSQATSLAFREVDATLVSIFGFSIFASDNLQVTATNSSATLDLVCNMFLTENNALAPLALSAYFHDQSQWSGVGALSSLSAASFSASGSIGGIAYLGVYEFNAQGQQINFVDFSTLALTASALSTAGSGQLSYATFTGTKSGATYTFTVIQSSVRSPAGGAAPGGAHASCRRSSASWRWAPLSRPRAWT
jgi:hypothetical protein